MLRELISLEAVRRLVSGNRTETSAQATDGTDADRPPSPPQSTADVHQTLVGPASIERQSGAVRVGEGIIETRWIGEYPDAPADGFLERLYSSPATSDTDISIHIRPRDTAATLDSLENRIEDLQADYEYLSEKHRASARGVERDLADHEDLYDALRNTPTTAFDVSTYLAVRGDEADSREVDSTARQSPANLTPIAPRWLQLDAFVSCSPIGVDALDREMDTTTPMLGGAVGAMFPFVSGARAEPGIEYGAYAVNGSPLVFDRFERETGYCAMVIGKLGAGKSFSTKLQLLRRVMYDDETVVVMLDPLRGFADVSVALGAERVTVGGTRGINPLDIQPTPAAVLRTVPDLDPWAEQIAWVLTFFETFFAEVATDPLGDRRQTLRRAVQATYERRGITRDPATHDEPSPTVRDVISVLDAMLDAPRAFGYETDAVATSVKSDAQSLLKELRPSFRPGGDLANLAKPTEFDLDSRAIYLDLHQAEGGQGRSQTSLMMQVLFNAVYERAKTTDERVVFAIDEAHYLLNDAASLDFIETAVRHSRHYDLSVQFVTQTGGEFTLTPEARTIANLCSLTLIHRVSEEADKLAEWFGLSDRQADWVRTATAGNDADGYAEALLQLDEEGWFPLRVRASDAEADALSDADTGFRWGSTGGETVVDADRSETG